jgi:hypothetical protein
MARRLKSRSCGDEALLSHASEFGLTVVEAAAKLPAFAGQGRHVVEAALKRLESGGMLASTWLYSERRCFYPIGGNASSRTAAHRSGHISEETKIRRFAMLSFCTLGTTPRIRPAAALLQTHFPDSFLIRQSHAYYLQPAALPVLGFLRVDMGGAGRWDRVLAKCLDDARKHASDPAWAPLVKTGQVEITLATTFAQKAERLCRALSDLSQPPLPIRVVAIPELLYLIAPPAS